MIKVFHYEDDARGKIKREIMKRIRKNWKDTRHNLYHKCYKEIRTYEKNLEHRPKGIEENEWKKFLDYRQKEETKNALNQSKQLYTHIGGSKTLARKKRRSEQGRLVGRGELFIMTHKKKMARISNPMRVLLDESFKHLLQNDSLAQVLRKEHPGRVCALSAGPCPTQVFGNAAGQPLGSAEPNEEYERRITELTAKLEEEQVKRQSIHEVLGYLVQQQGGILPAEVAAELAFLGSTPDSSRARPSTSGNHDPQQKF
ncbi:hypothetical protein Ahy_A10g050875 [Arachis hypogaea]|uniref:Uncharacterized protein n=1 Tax=Arachis hypogaea TaxID=3818 RepID=A0A445BAR3_ARAHY|nr:hypothetical protein Ahy_A10g050875 [Arachis hypogaea]